MWGFQHHFRRGLEYAASSLFEQIGFGLDPRAYLVGFATDPHATFAVCVEPENDPLAAIDLSDVPDRAKARYKADPESRIIMTSARHRERHHQTLHDSHRAQALRESLEGDQHGADRYFFVGASAPVDNYEIHPVLAVPRARWDSKPALSRCRIDRYAVVPSFQHALVRELLRTATADLHRAEPPEQFSLQWTDRSELIRKAAREFVQSVSLYSGHEFPSELTVALDEISTQPYEGRTGAGGLLLASEANQYVDRALTFLEPIHLSQTRSLRKALEMTDNNHLLHCDGEKVTGLARLTDEYEPADENAFRFRILSRGTWELSHHNQPMLRVANTRPTLPQPRLDADHFKGIASRVFPEAAPADVDYLWDLTLGASDAAHGTMLVVHRRASAEAQRLVPQAQRTQPQRLSADVGKVVTNIDGAVLVDVTGNCHAVGVILDGHATGVGDPSRGARYNSAVRYHAAQVSDCLVIIVSEDGMINLLPDLRRQVSRRAVEEVVQDLEDTITDNPDYEVFFRHWDHLESLAFYLTEEQCARVNAARQALEDHRAKPEPNPDGLGRITHVSWTPLEPNPAMNSSYFLDESDEAD